MTKEQSDWIEMATISYGTYDQLRRTIEYLNMVDGRLNGPASKMELLACLDILNASQEAVWKT